MKYNTIFSHNFIKKRIHCFKDRIKWHLYIKRSNKEINGCWQLIKFLWCPLFFPTGILHLSLPERGAHTFMYINYGAFITSLPTYLDKSMVGFFFLCAISILVAFLFPNIFQKVYTQSLFFMYFSFLCLATLCLDVLLGSP